MTNRTDEVWKLFQTFSGESTWPAKCVYKLKEAAERSESEQNHILAGLVGIDGTRDVFASNKSDWSTGDIWGIDRSLCNQYCSRKSLPMVFNYEMFLTRTTNYLLPWLALTAQLPYEAGDVIDNMMSFVIALGSPMLLTFSLMMTILNRRWLRKRVRSIRSGSNKKLLQDRLRDVERFLEAAQQVPLRLRPYPEWIASLLLLKHNDDWWSNFTGRLDATRRKPTLSLVAQMLVAVTAWILTIIGSFGSSLGDHAEGLALSSSTLWTWLVPLILGWITVGTQSRPDDISEYSREAYCGPLESGNLVIWQKQKAFKVLDLKNMDKVKGKTDHHRDPLEVFRNRQLNQHPGIHIRPRQNSTNDNGQSAIQADSQVHVGRTQSAFHPTETVDGLDTPLRLGQPNTPVGPEIGLAESSGASNASSNGPASPRFEGAGVNRNQPATVDTGCDKSPTCPDLSFFGFSIHGDGIKKGPVYNYARMYTWRHAASQLLKVLEEAKENMDDESQQQQDQGQQYQQRHDRPQQENEQQGQQPEASNRRPLPPRPFNTISYKEDDLKASDVRTLAVYCKLVEETRPGQPDSDLTLKAKLAAYPDREDLDDRFPLQVIGAILVAAFLQWGTTTPAIIISILIDVKGLGCRSGGYLLYGLLSTGAFFCFLFSVVLTREAMLKVQKFEEAQLKSQNPEHLRVKGPGLLFHVYKIMSILLLLIGRVIVIANALWLVLTSLFELVGFYYNCWCESVYLVWRERAWVMLFKKGVDLAEQSRGPWVGSVTMSTLVMILSYLVFALLRWGN